MGIYHIFAKYRFTKVDIPDIFQVFSFSKVDAQMKFEFPVCKSKFQSSEICKIKCQKGREETEVNITNLAVKFARLETSLANRLK